MLNTCGYLRYLHDPRTLARIVDRCTAAIPFGSTDMIVCRGVSGLAIASPVSIRLGLPLAVVRKEHSSHAYGIEYEGPLTAERFVIIDDQIDSGDTIRAILDAVASAHRYLVTPAPTCVKIVLWNHPLADDQFQGIPVLARPDRLLARPRLGVAEHVERKA